MKIYKISLILFDTEISLCDLIGRMVVEFHQHGRLRALLPRMVAECFSERVAADMLFETGVAGSFFDDAIGLIAGERSAFLLSASEKIVCLCGRAAHLIVLCQRRLFILIDGYNSFFSGFLFGNTNVFAKFPPFVIIYIVPLKL